METCSKGIILRRAHAEDSEPLTQLSLRSKAYWGYSPEFMLAWKPELTISREYLTCAPVFVAEREAALLGFFGLSRPGCPPELVFLFIDPPYIGKGLGTLLWRETLRVATDLGWKDFLIIGDPNAEGFYLNHGAVRIGEKEYPCIPNRKLPVLHYKMG